MNSQLVQELQREHAFIVGKLDEVKRHGVHTKVGLDALISAKRALLAHLKKEDAQLYPALAEAAKSDTELQTLLQMMGQDMQQVTRTALDFFAKYEKGAAENDLGLARDFGALRARLGLRIQAEESTLYAQFDRLKASNG